MMKRLAALAACAALGSFPACAQPALQAQLSHCLAITGLLQRLQCYDDVTRGAGIAAASQPRIAPAAPMPPASVPPASVPLASLPPSPVPPTYIPPPVPAPSFGSERLPQTQTARRAQNRVVSSLTGFDTDLRGKFTVTLANGQVWKQLDGDDAIARPRKSARSVTIERAIFGSYALTFNDSSQRYKVVRVQ